MKKSIKVIIDENGNLESDFSGFKDNECKGEEEKFRKLLEVKYGIFVKSSKIIPKNENINRNSSINKSIIEV